MLDNIISLIPFLLLSLIHVALFFMRRRAKLAQEEAVKSLSPDGQDTWFRIKIAWPLSYRNKNKLFGLEGHGLLIDSGEQIRIVGQFLFGQKIERRHQKSEMDLRWLGNFYQGQAPWISLGTATDALMLAADTKGRDVAASHKALVDMCRKIAPDFDLAETTKPLLTMYALEKNPASLATMLLSLALVTYAALDGMTLNSNVLLGLGYAHLWLLLPTLPFGILCHRQLKKRQVPPGESRVLAMLLLISLGLAEAPLLMRIDQGLAGGQTERIAYVKTGDLSYAPKMAGPPNLDFQAYTKRYWAQFEKGSTYQFEFVHGPLGLWQLVYASVDKEIERFNGKN